MDALGPLGNGYDLSRRTDHAVLVAGGYGVAPLLFLARALHEGKVAEKISLLVGARTEEHLLWRDRISAHPWLDGRFATADGSAGSRGTVIDLLDGLPSAGRIYACGPMAMLAAVARRRSNTPNQAAVESQMGCGIGACMGCVIPTRPESRYGRYARVCMEGPVFDAKDVDWEAITASNSESRVPSNEKTKKRSRR